MVEAVVVAVVVSVDIAVEVCVESGVVVTVVTGVVVTLVCDVLVAVDVAVVVMSGHILHITGQASVRLIAPNSATSHSSSAYRLQSCGSRSPLHSRTVVVAVVVAVELIVVDVTAHAPQVTGHARVKLTGCPSAPQLDVAVELHADSSGFPSHTTTLHPCRRCTSSTMARYSVTSCIEGRPLPPVFGLLRLCRKISNSEQV